MNFHPVSSDLPPSYLFALPCLPEKLARHPACIIALTPLRLLELSRILIANRLRRLPLLVGQLFSLMRSADDYEPLGVEEVWEDAVAGRNTVIISELSFRSNPSQDGIENSRELASVEPHFKEFAWLPSKITFRKQVFIRLRGEFLEKKSFFIYISVFISKRIIIHVFPAANFSNVI